MKILIFAFILTTSALSLADSISVLCSSAASLSSSVPQYLSCNPTSVIAPTDTTNVSDFSGVVLLQGSEFPKSNLSITNLAGLPIYITESNTVPVGVLSVYTQNQDNYPIVSILSPGIINANTTNPGVSQNAGNTFLIGDTLGPVTIDSGGYVGNSGLSILALCYQKAVSGYYGDATADTIIKAAAMTSTYTNMTPPVCDDALLTTIITNAPPSLFCPAGLSYQPSIAPDDTYPPTADPPLSFNLYRKPWANVCQEVIYINQDIPNCTTSTGTTPTCDNYPPCAVSGVSSSTGSSPGSVSTTQGIIACEEVEYIPEGVSCNSLNTPTIPPAISPHFAVVGTTQDYYCDGLGNAPSNVSPDLCVTPGTPSSDFLNPLGVAGNQDFGPLVSNCSNSSCPNGEYSALQIQFPGVPIQMQTGETGSYGGIVNIFGYDINYNGNNSTSNTNPLTPPSVNFSNGANGSNSRNDYTSKSVTKYCINIQDNSLSPDSLPLTSNARKLPTVMVAAVEFYPIKVLQPVGTVNVTFPATSPLNYGLMKRIDPTVADFIFNGLMNGH